MHHQDYTRTTGIDAASDYLTRNYNERKAKRNRAEQFLNFAFGFFCGGALVLCALHFAGFIP